jgi:hypothetical protein
MTKMRPTAQIAGTLLLLLASDSGAQWQPAARPSIKSLEPEHPCTATVTEILAAGLQAQGRYGEAEALFRRALAIRERVMGPEHANTASSLNNLAGLLSEQAQFQELLLSCQ